MRNGVLYMLLIFLVTQAAGLHKYAIHVYPIMMDIIMIMLFEPKV